MKSGILIDNRDTFMIISNDFFGRLADLLILI